jgi:hypothetical protein
MGGKPGDWATAPQGEMLVYGVGRNHVTSGRRLWLR